MQEAEASKVANNITLYRDAYVRPIGTRNNHNNKDFPELN